MSSGRVSYDFSGCVVVVTGAARGQGLSHALAFAEAGARVYAFDRRSPNAAGIPYPLSSDDDWSRAEAQLAAASTQAYLRHVDVTDEGAVESAFKEISAEVAHIDVLVNNAGVNSIDEIAKIDRVVWNAIVDVNLFGAMVCCKHAVPLMHGRDDGRIINIASLAGILGAPKQAHYAASKAGLIGLTRSLAVELGPGNIRVNAVCPTLVATPQTRGLSKANPVRLSADAAAAMPYVLPGLAALKPRNVTDAVLWLASEGAKFVTGITLAIDAGRSIR